MALTVVQINHEIGKQVGYFRAKGFKLEWTLKGGYLHRCDTQIIYTKGSWQVFEIVDKIVQSKPVSKHHSLYMALKSVN